MKMNKILTVSCCLLGLAMAGIPAYANPMRKKITIDCSNVTAPNSITGTASVILCGSSSTDYCANQYQCPSVSCNSKGVVSITVMCDAGFKVDHVIGPVGVKEYDDPDQVNVIGTGGGNLDSTLGGKGISILYLSNSGDASAVALKIK
jgi:hypothetical protein